MLHQYTEPPELKQAGGTFAEQRAFRIGVVSNSTRAAVQGLNSVPNTTMLARPLQANRAQIEGFLKVLFKRCADYSANGHVALRAFRHEPNECVLNEWVAFGGNLISVAVERATAVANRPAGQEAVFCILPALFGDKLSPKGRRSAAEVNVIAAPVINVELDERPRDSLEKLEHVLGPATLVIASGGRWVGPNGAEDKLHVYWRLAKPAVSEEDKALLKRVRMAATALVGADRTAPPLCHPMRTPGSWHTKTGSPRPCEIIRGGDAHEVELQEVADKLAAMVSVAPSDNADRRGVSGFKTKKAWPLEALMAAAAVLPNDGLAWSDWNHALMVFFDSSHGSAEGLEAAHAFSEKSGKYDPEETDDRWRHFHTSPPTNISDRTLLQRVRNIDPAFRDPNELKPEDWFDELPDEAADQLFPASQPARLLELVSFDDAAGSALKLSSKPLVKGVLDQGALSVLYGESNVGKTFVAMDIAFHVAAGLDWGGRRTARLGVIYVAAEGGPGARRRAAALDRRFAGKVVERSRFDFRLAGVNLRSAEADLLPLIETVRAQGDVGLIVIDTLSRALAGGDENASTDMGELVKNIDRLRQATRAHVMLVHHSGKDRARGARGHSLLRAATDTEIEIADNEITVTKQRDLDGDFRRAFVLERVELGKDGDGDPITSCTVRLVSQSEKPAGEPTEAEIEILAALRDLHEGDMSAKGFKAEEIAETFVTDGAAIKVETVRTRLRAMEAKRLVWKPKKGLWCIKPDTLSGGNRSTALLDLLDAEE